MAGKREGWLIRAAWLVLGGCLVATASCGLPDALVNNTVTLGGTTPGGRGNVQVSIINNTQYYVSMTFGTYDPLDKTLVPNYKQIYADSTHTSPRLEPGATSSTFTFTSGRSLSLGDRGLIQAIQDRDTSAKGTTFTEGITFSDKLLDEQGVTQFTINGVNNQVQLLGVDFQVESLLIFTLQPDTSQPNGVRIDVDIALP